MYNFLWYFFQCGYCYHPSDSLVTNYIWLLALGLFSKPKCTVCICSDGYHGMADEFFQLLLLSHFGVQPPVTSGTRLGDAAMPSSFKTLSHCGRSWKKIRVEGVDDQGSTSRGYQLKENAAVVRVLLFPVKRSL